MNPDPYRLRFVQIQGDVRITRRPLHPTEIVESRLSILRNPTNVLGTRNGGVPRRRAHQLFLKLTLKEGR
jgi:hypothetical protein